MLNANLLVQYIVMYTVERRMTSSVVNKEFDLHDIVEMKKPHPCGTNRWKVIRMGMDIRIKCEGCGHSVLMPRREFTRKMKKILEKSGES
jgi:hypothetical protein